MYYKLSRGILLWFIKQWNDTRNTVGTINKLINDNFLPDNAPVTEATTPSDPNVSTTAAPFKITRKEFNRIVQRNLRGLQRLYNLELQDALKQIVGTAQSGDRHLETRSGVNVVGASFSFHQASLSAKLKDVQQAIISKG
ncbi:hypothetical protein NQ315_015529 [Exocentrus adspersus]|uniref:Uncharacterized protein n=1 Tax=Exocentrus adspersus TaxID=1586481 RepID=A0AAV8VPE2_9CUCU|nr:hypothetical protein NQ315_015529 [Exocentrus adspersus]